MHLDKIKNLVINNSGFILAFIFLSLVYLLALQYVPATITVEMKTSADDTGQLFFDRGLGFRETDSIWFPVTGSNEYEKYRVKLPGARITSLRIDPLSREGTFAIRSISIETAGKKLRLEKEELEETLTPLNQVELFYRDGVVHGVSTGIDPFFQFDAIRNANRLPFYVALVFYLVLLLLLWGAKILFSEVQAELFFALFLLVFALPAMFPPIFSLILALLAVILFFFLFYRYTKSRKDLLLEKRPFIPAWTWLKNKRSAYTACFFLILLLAFLLRFANLTILDPYTDEYSHLLAAKDYLDLGYFHYARASMVTYLVIFFSRLGNAASFYEYVFWGRLPGVIFSTLTVIPLYFLTRKISPSVALISIFLWATSPWSIGVAKTIREYAFHPFFILLALLTLVKFLELLADFKIRRLPLMILYLLPAAALAGYAFRYDTASTLRICIVVFAAAAAYYFVAYLLRFKNLAKTGKIAFIVALIPACLVAAWMLVYASSSGHVSIDDLQLSDYWLRVFLVPGSPSTPLHWWGDYPFLAVAIFICGTGFVHAVFQKRHRYYFMHFTVFAVLLAFYVFFFDRYDRPRYIFYALPFFIPLVAVSVYALVDYAGKLKPLSLKIIGTLAAVIFLFQAFNYQNIIYPVFSGEHGYVKTTNEHHDSLKSTIELLEKEISLDDVFIVTVARGALELGFNIDSDRIYGYSFKDKNRFEKVASIIEANPQGFMILDWRRNGYYAEGYPHEGQFLIGDTTVEVIMNKDGMQIYRWKR